MTINQKFVQYLLSSYLYYVEGRSIFADAEFDALCKELLDRWDEVSHRHKHLTSREDLEAGTGYAIQYPSIVIGAARHWWYSKNGVPAERKKSGARRVNPVV
jgi:hypothetical protein